MYFARRILGMIPLLLLISFLAFALIRKAPGGPFDRDRKPASPEIERNLAAKYHLDQPIWKQYLFYLGIVGDGYLLIKPSASGSGVSEDSVLGANTGASFDHTEEEIALLKSLAPPKDSLPVGAIRVFAAFEGVRDLRTNAAVFAGDYSVGYVDAFLPWKGVTNGAAVIHLTQPEKVPDGSVAEIRWARSGILQGDLGPSLRYRNHTVNDIVTQALPVSLTLGGLAFAFAIGIGIPLGFYTAVERGKLGDYIGSFFALLAFCIPAFVIGPILIMLFAVKLRLLPVALWESPLHFILPTAALGLYFAGRIARLMREGMSETLHAGFITTARAKGASERAVLWKHAFRLAVLPVVSYSGPLLADLLTGSFVVETIFQIPGIGPFMVNSTLNRDYTMVVGLVLLYAVLLLVLNLLVDFSYSWLDRRVKYE